MNLPDFLHFIPFVGMVAQKDADALRPLVTTVIEKVVLSALGGLVAVYISVKVMETEINQIHNDVMELKTSVNEMRHDLYVPKGDKR